MMSNAGGKTPADKPLSSRRRVTDEELRWLRDDLLEPDIRVIVIERLLETEGNLDRMVEPIPDETPEEVASRQERFENFMRRIHESRD